MALGGGNFRGLGRSCSWLVVAWLAGLPAAGNASPGGSGHARMGPAHEAFLATHCLRCHDAAETNGGVRLDDLPLAIDDVATAERWQKVIGVLNSGDMPPEDEPQPPAAAKAEFLEGLSKQLVVARKALADSGGVITMRRLNRREYVNTIRDLLDVEVDVRDLPADDDGGSFDTIGSSLFFSSDQFEHYLRIGRAALDNAIVSGPRPQSKTVRTEAETIWTKKIQDSLDKLSADNQRAVDWKASGRPAGEFGFNDEGDAGIHMQLFREYSPSHISYLADPLTASGAMVQYIYGLTFSLDTTIPPQAPPGRYVIRARVASESPDGKPRFLEYGTIGKGASIAEFSDIRCRQVVGTFDSPEIVELPITVPATGPRTFGIRERRHNGEWEAIALFWRRLRANKGDGYRRTLWVDWVEWEGPLSDQWPPRSHELALGGIDTGCSPGDAEARAVVEQFATRAFRGRAVWPAYVDGLMKQYQARRAAGEPFAEAIKTPLSIVLASPSFLYIAEPAAQPRATASDAAGSPSSALARTPLAPVELANRLAYFLWSGPPDGQLIVLALSGRLSRPDVLAAEVDRLLADDRSTRFISGFLHQWLHMVRLDFFQFNNELYPEFDASVKAAARREVYETFRVVQQEDLPLKSLLEADFVVVDGLLADYYGLEGVSGAEFRRVPVPAGMPRGGLLGMAAILAMGSDGERSSPVERGAWVLRKLLHDPPPPAPANVPQLARFVGKPLSARELMTAHQEQPQCVHCHRRIDPIGYGLEHFNAVGLWRDAERLAPNRANKLTRVETFPIDAQGELPDGMQFDGFEQLRHAVARHEADFARGLTEHLIEFALGRPCSFSDEELVASILERAKARAYTPRAIIQALVASGPFQSK